MGTSLVFSVEGQQAVLPAWYTSHSLEQPYVTWMLNKNAGPFQVRGTGAAGQEMDGDKLGGDHGGDGAHDGGKIMVPSMGEWPQWKDAHDGEVAVVEGSSWCIP